MDWTDQFPTGIIFNIKPTFDFRKPCPRTGANMFHTILRHWMARTPPKPLCRSLSQSARFGRHAATRPRLARPGRQVLLAPLPGTATDADLATLHRPGPRLSPRPPTDFEPAAWRRWSATSWSRKRPFRNPFAATPSGTAPTSSSCSIRAAASFAVSGTAASPMNSSAPHGCRCCSCRLDRPPTTNTTKPTSVTSAVLDGTPEAEQILDPASWLGALGADLTHSGVVPTSSGESAASHYLLAVAERLRGDGATVHTRTLVASQTANALLHEADADDDLLARNRRAATVWLVCCIPAWSMRCCTTACIPCWCSAVARSRVAV